MKDAEGRDIAIPSSEGEEQLVDYQGMLVSGAIAQRRGWVQTRDLTLSRLRGRDITLSRLRGRDFTLSRLSCDKSILLSTLDSQVLLYTIYASRQDEF